MFLKFNFHVLTVCNNDYFSFRQKKSKSQAVAEQNTPQKAENDANNQNVPQSTFAVPNIQIAVNSSSSVIVKRSANTGFKRGKTVKQIADISKTLRSAPKEPSPISTVISNLQSQSSDTKGRTISALLQKRKHSQASSIESYSITNKSNSAAEVQSIDSSDVDVHDVDENVAGENGADENVADENVAAVARVKWNFERQFDSKVELDEFLASEGCWSIRDSQRTANGLKVIYRCILTKKVGEQCASGLYTLQKFVSDNEGTDSDEDDKVIYLVYRKSTEHTHETSTNKATKLKKAVHDKIIASHGDGKMPMTIFYDIIDDETIPVGDRPTHRQVVNAIQNYKKKTFGTQPITMRSLSDFVYPLMDFPETEDDAFVLNFIRSPSNQRENKFFTIIITTPRLLRNAANLQNIHADGTMKITTEKLPLIVIGSTDMNQHFHLIAIAVTKFQNADAYGFAFNAIKYGAKHFVDVDIEPTALICDADPAIPLGFGHAYDKQQVTVIMCYAHVMGNVQRKYSFKDSKKNKEPLKDDLRVLHRSPDERTFDIGCALFVAKWKSKEKEVVRLLEKSFFKKNKNWYIGCKPRAPKHNNALERFNGTMKMHQTVYRKKPLQQFLPKAFKIVRQRSKEYLKGKQEFQTEIPITKELMKSGKDCKKSYVFGDKKTNGDRDFFVFASEEEKEITEDDVDAFQNSNYTNFEKFKKEAFKIYTITFKDDINDWKLATCTCPAFDQQFMCKHIISIAYELGALNDSSGEDDDLASDYDDEPLFTPTRGRPKRPGPALELD